jgi:dTDP-4-dehydrorhamnose reductase
VAAQRPMNSVMDCSKIRHALDIENQQWQTGLDVLLDHLK